MFWAHKTQTVLGQNRYSSSFLTFQWFPSNTCRLITRVPHELRMAGGRWGGRNRNPNCFKGAQPQFPLKTYKNLLLQLHVTYLAYFDLWEQNGGLNWTLSPERTLQELLDTKQAIKTSTVTVEIQLHHSHVEDSQEWFPKVRKMQSCSCILLHWYKLLQHAIKRSRSKNKALL